MIGIYNASSSLMMTASYFSLLSKQSLVREKEYKIRALSGETNNLYSSIWVPFPFAYYASEAPVQYTRNPFRGAIVMTSSSGRSVAWQVVPNKVSSQKDDKKVDKCLAIYRLLRRVLDIILLK